MITMPSVWTSREATLVYVKMVTMVMDLLAQVSYIYMWLEIRLIIQL